MAPESHGFLTDQPPGKTACAELPYSPQVKTIAADAVRRLWGSWPSSASTGPATFSGKNARIRLTPQFLMDWLKVIAREGA